MNPDHLKYLVCPATKQPLKLGNSPIVENSRIREGTLLEEASGKHYPIVKFIPRFVPAMNYASNFGLEWTIHNKTQYDDRSGFDVSKERFTKETQWDQNLRGKTILEVGCGSGRFTKHALETGAMVISFDYSNAVESNYASNAISENLLIVQASILAPPFLPNSFDMAYCFGVLQHTPDPKAAFLSTVDLVKPGGKIASDIYIKNLARWLLNTKYYVRPFIQRDDPKKLYQSLKSYVDFMWPLAKIIRKIPKIGPSINWRLLVADYSNVLPNATDATLRDWAYLDTFDMLSPAYDKPATVKTFRQWHIQAGLVDTEVNEGYNGVEGRGTKPKL